MTQQTQTKPDLPLLAQGPTIHAQADRLVECAGCGDRLRQGEQITYTAEGWAHAVEVLDKAV